MTPTKTPEGSGSVGSLQKSLTSLGIGDWVRIGIVILIIVGAYAGGVMAGLEKSEKYDRKYSNSHDMKHDDQRDTMADVRYGGNNEMKIAPVNHATMSMTDMAKSLEGKTGAELNKAFLEGMIVHHEGAVAMAKYLANSDKPELVKLGSEIISAQGNEIAQMKAWQIAWGYTATGNTLSGSTSKMNDMMREHCLEMPSMVGCEQYK